MTTLVERRRHHRTFGRGLIVLGPDGHFPVIDISPAGLCLTGKPYAIGETVVVTIASVSNGEERVDATCRVVAITARATHLAFASVTMALMTYIVQHIGTELGVTPYYFNKKKPQARAVA